MGTFAHKLERFIQRLQHDCSLSRTDIESMLGCKLGAKADSLPIGNIDQLLSKLHVTLDAINKDKVDYQIIRDRLAERQTSLALRYVSGVQTSSRFTTAYMADFIRKTNGENAVKALHQHFQFDDDHTAEYTLRNNILLPRDICSYVAQYYGIDHVENMGMHSIKLMEKRLAGLGLKSLRTWQDYVVKFISDVTPKMVERNYVWHITGVTTHAVYVSGKATSEFAECYPELIKNSPIMERLRLGYMRGLLSYYDNGRYEVTQLQSITHGHETDLYQLTRLDERQRLQLVQ